MESNLFYRVIKISRFRRHLITSFLATRLTQPREINEKQLFKKSLKKVNKLR